MLALDHKKQPLAPTFLAVAFAAAAGGVAAQAPWPDAAGWDPATLVPLVLAALLGIARTTTA